MGNVTPILAAASLGVTATVTAPTNGAAIATLTTPAAGIYRVYVKSGYGGTADVINGMEFRKGASAITTLFVKALANTSDDQVFEFIELDGATSLSVNARQAGAIGSIYNAQIIATRVTPS